MPKMNCFFTRQPKSTKEASWKTNAKKVQQNLLTSLLINTQLKKKQIEKILRTTKRDHRHDAFGVYILYRQKKKPFLRRDIARLI